MESKIFQQLSSSRLNLLGGGPTTPRDTALGHSISHRKRPTETNENINGVTNTPRSARGAGSNTCGTNGTPFGHGVHGGHPTTPNGNHSTSALMTSTSFTNAPQQSSNTTAKHNSTLNSSMTENPPKRTKVTYPVPNQCMEEGHFYVVLGEDVDTSSGRYKILSLLGQGTFGKVVEAWDRSKKEYCAVKIVRNTPKYTRDAQIEVKYMERVCQRDPYGEYAFVRVLRHFINDQGHMCIVMPKHGKCLLDCLQKSGPLTCAQIAQVAYQLCRTLDFLHSQTRFIHTDLKPENILLESNGSVNPMQIRVCDLGGCSDERHGHTSIVSTRHYRAPEVILGLGWMYAADMWSVGCILYELYTGRLLYDTHDNLEHLTMMTATIGPLPSDWGMRCMDECKPLFHSSAPYSLKPCAKSSRLQRCAPIESTIRDEYLANLIRGLLHYDQSLRLTARQVMAHPFVMKYCPDAVQVATNPIPIASPIVSAPQA